MSKHDTPLNKLDNYRWEIPVSYRQGMKVPGLIYADEAMMETIRNDQSIEQVANVAFLPGIVGRSLAMPDIHWGYGFPIGGVAATRVSDGVISPGGVGYDINCGVRLLRTNLTDHEVRPKIRALLNNLFNNVPSGLGSKGKIKTTEKELEKVMTEGAGWAINRGLGFQEDIDVTEEKGCMEGANPEKVSARAKQRGMPQLGTLGSGNHFLEVQVVKEIYDREASAAMGIEDAGQVLLLIHTGSRGFGHQICDDYLRIMAAAVRKYGIELPDRQLACAPTTSEEGKDYLSAMACAANFAWTNRQCITHWVRESLVSTFGKSYDELGMHQIYDVTHNIAKIEEHVVNGKKLRLCVHRKGATRAFPPGHDVLPQRYRDIGQPVLIPGDMGRYSYIAVGTAMSMTESFGSTCHGAGRLQSRGAARRSLRGSDIARELELKGITVKTADMASLAEEAPQAYKDVSEVVEVAQQAGISRKIAKTCPLGIIKG
jgi:tRNA-splicing ligase RtcB